MKALLIEDDPNYAEVVMRFNPSISWSWAKSAAQAKEMLESQEWDLVWEDLRLPDSLPEETLALVRAHCKHAAVVAVSGAVDFVPDIDVDAFARKDMVMTPEAMDALIDTALSRRKSKPNFEKSVQAVEALSQIIQP